MTALHSSSRRSGRACCRPAAGAQPIEILKI
jgi:hypothetical protein